MVKILFLHLTEMFGKQREGEELSDRHSCASQDYTWAGVGKNQHSLVEWGSVKESEGLKWQE